MQGGTLLWISKKTFLMATTSENMATTAADSKLQQFFEDQLQDMYWAEKKLVKVLPKLQEAATGSELKSAFGNHLEQTRNHVSRLENVFQIIGKEPRSRKCPAMAGIAEEGEDIIDETDTASAQRDVGLIFAAQKAEHYEIATYGGLCQLARTLGYEQAAEVLGQTLTEEKETDALLTQIAEGNVNKQARREPQTA